MNVRVKPSGGIGLVGVLLLTPLALLVLTFAFYEARKAYWDYQVDKLCEQDGGVKINEIMYLDAPQYESFIDKKFNTGEIVIPQKGSSESINSAVFFSTNDLEIRASNPRVVKSVSSVIRTSDAMEIATSTIYWRSDGDLISFQPSSHICSKTPHNFFDLVIKSNGSKK